MAIERGQNFVKVLPQTGSNHIYRKYFFYNFPVQLPLKIVNLKVLSMKLGKHFYASLKVKISSVLMTPHLLVVHQTVVPSFWLHSELQGGNSSSDFFCSSTSARAAPPPPPNTPSLSPPRWTTSQQAFLKWIVHFVNFLLSTNAFAWLN